MTTDEFINQFTEIQHRFDCAQVAHLRTPWWRWRKMNRHLKEMQAATADMEKLGRRVKRKGLK